MFRSIRRLALVGVVAAVAAAGGVVAVSAATGSPSPSSSSSPPTAHKGPHHGIFRIPRVAGKVVSDTASGGLLHKGVLVIQEPNGTDVTLNLTAGTKAWRYQGVGVKPVSESPSSLPVNTVVVVAGRGVNGSRHLARRILDLGFTASSTTG